MKKFLLLTTALIALGAGPAHAGPVAGVVAWVGGIISSGGIAGALMQAALGVGANLLASALSKPPGASIEVQSEIEFGDDTALNFIVGKYATAGKIKYRGSWGKNTRFITEVFEVSCLPQGLHNIWVDDALGDFNGNIGFVDESASAQSVQSVSEGASVPVGSLELGAVLTNNSDDGSRLWVKWVDGTQTVADPFLIWAFGSGDYPWTAAHIGAGKSYAIVTSRYDDDTQTSLSSFMFEPEPLALYDPRKDSSVGGLGAHRWGDFSTYEATSNAAVICYNIARGVYWQGEWVYGGKNLDAWRLPLPEWVAAMNAADATVDLSNGSSEAAYRAGANVTVNIVPADLLEDIGLASNMRFAEVGGKLKPIVDVPTTAVLGITDDDIVVTKGQSLTPFLSVSDTYNALSATYPEPDENWTTKDATEYVDADATAADGGRYLPTSLSYAACPYPYQVQRLMRSQMRDYRRMRQHQFHLPPDAYALEPLVDCVSWTSARNGYANKLFLVTNVSKTPGMSVLVTLSEMDPSDYDWSTSYETDVAVIAPRPNETPTQSITNFAADGVAILDTDGVSRRPAILVSCDTDEVGVTNIRIQARLMGTTVAIYDEILPFSDVGTWYIHNVIGGQSYQVRAELLSSMTPFSEWSVWITAAAPSIGLSANDLSQEILGTIETATQTAEAAQQDAANALGAAALVQSNLDQTNQSFDDEIERIDSVTDGISNQVDTANDLITSEVARLDGVAGQIEQDLLALNGSYTQVSTDLSDLTSKVGDAESAITNEATTRASADAAMASDITSVTTRVGGAEGAITNEATVRANADAVITSTVSGLTSRVGDAESAIEDEATTRADADTALSSDILALTSRVGATEATLTTDFYTIAQTDGEISSAVSALENALLSQIETVAGYNNGWQIILDDVSKGVNGAVVTSSAGASALGQAGTVIVAQTGAPDGGLITNGYSVQIPASQAVSFQDKRIKISVLARKPVNNAANHFGIAYSTADTGNSGYMSASEDLSTSWKWFEFYYDVLPANGGGADYIGVFGDESESGLTTEFARIIVEISAEADDLPEIASITANLESNYYTSVQTDGEISSAVSAAQTALQSNIDGVSADLDANYYTSAETDSAISVMETTLNATIDGVSATVDEHAATLVDLEGFSQAYAGLTVEAYGGYISGFKATSWGNPDGTGGATLELLGDVIAEGSMATNKLLVGLGANLLTNTDFSDGVTGWTCDTSGGQLTETTLGLRPAGTVHAGSYYPTLMIYQSGASATGEALVRHRPYFTDGNVSVGVPVVEGLWVEARVQASIIRCTISLRIEFYDEDGVSLGLSSVLDTSPYEVVNGLNPESWPVYWGKAQAPTGCAYATIVVSKSATESGASSYIFLHKPQIAITHEAATEVTPYSPSGSTLITGDKIMTGSIVAEKLDVSELSAISTTVGILRTATSGARQEIHSDKIVIYDVNGAVRVKLGNLA